MNIDHFARLLATAALCCASNLAAALTTSASTDADYLAGLLAGPGIAISDAALAPATDTAAGTFAEGADGIGFDHGVLLTTGTVDCAAGANTQPACSDSGTLTSFRFNFTTTTGNLFLRYVFGSEEYPKFAHAQFNDSLELRLNNQNIALLPNGGGPVEVDNINDTKNTAFFRPIAPLSTATQYNGLTTVLTASATGLSGVNTLEVRIRDGRDNLFDSGVFLPAGGLSSALPIPEPAGYSMLLAGLGLIGWTLCRRRA